MIVDFIFLRHCLHSVATILTSKETLQKNKHKSLNFPPPVAPPSSGQPQAKLHPAAAPHADSAAQDQAEALWSLGIGEERPAGVPQVWHPAQLLQKEEAAHGQRNAPPQLARQLQTTW